MNNEYTQTIRRRQDGSIDYEHYIAKVRVQRSKSFHQLLACASLTKALGLFCKTTKNARVSAIRQ